MSKLGRPPKHVGSDPLFLAEIRKLPCICCGSPPPSEAHHIKTRGSGGKDDFFNLIPLCKLDHTMGENAWHRIGSITFLKRFPWVADYLRQLGWTIQEYKLIPPSDGIKG